MDIEKMIEQLNGYFEGKGLKRCVALDAATYLSTMKKYCDSVCGHLNEAEELNRNLQAENEKLRAELEQVKAERDAAVEAVKNMAEYIVCAGRVDYYLCDEISQEHHLKYQPKNDGNYDNEPCYKCIADWFLQGHKWQENC